MNIEFQKIILSNFMSFGYADIDLSEPGFTLVSGVNKNVEDSASSNGSGKSSIWEAISWVLTGNTIRGCKNVTNSNGDDGALVELTCKIDGKEYIITRTKDHSKLKSSLKILIDGVDKSGKGIRDTEKLLAEYLPDITPSLIGSVVILGQGLPQRFTSNTPSGRKEVLEKLSNSDFMIEDIKTRISKRIENFISDRKSIELEQVKLNTKLNMLNETKAEASQKLSQFENLEQLKVELADINSDLQQQTATKENLEHDIKETSEKIDSNNSEQVKLSNEKASRIQSITEKHQTIIDSFKEQKLDLQAKITQLKKVIVQKESIVDVCPTCGQKLPNVQKLDATEERNLLTAAGVEAEKLNAAYTDALLKRDMEIKEGKELVEDQLLGIQAESINLKELLYSYNTKLSKCSDIIKDLTQTKTSIETKLQLSDAEMEYLVEKINNCDKELDSLNAKILYNDNVIEDISAHLDILNKLNTAVKRDFRGILLKNVIDFLNQKSKEYCNDVFNHTNIEFMLDGNNIAISINNKEYEQLSGGEKQKVDIIIQLAIRDMLCKYMDFSSNIFVLDEIFDNLDDSGSEKILNLLSKRLEDVSAIYIVTHHSSIQIPVDRELLVVKDSDGISRIES